MGGELHLAEAGLFLLAGIALGGAHFASLARVVTLYGAGARSSALLVQLARLLVLAVALILAAHEGALPLLAVALGILVARPLVTRGRRRFVR